MKKQPTPNHGPLKNIKVLDLTTVVMGPSATQCLGDLGAEIIKVEQPNGDSMRLIGPFKNPGMGPLYMMANRKKKSIVLDLKNEADKKILLGLASQVDVVVSNIRPQALKRLGLDYETISDINPEVIFCSAVGYGSAGPLSGNAVYDDLMQAASGISGLFRSVDGLPRYAPINLCDRVVGLYVVIAITSALNHLHQTGEGQEIEVPMFETMAQFVLSDHMGGAMFNPPLGPMGYKRLLSTTRGPYPTLDGDLSLVVYTNAHWRAFLELIGDQGLMERDPRFESQESRTQNAVAVGAYLAEKLLTRGNVEWLKVLKDADIPASPVNSIEDLLNDPHLAEVGFFEEIEHPSQGTLKLPKFPIQFSKSPASIRLHAPTLGENNADYKS